MKWIWILRMYQNYYLKIYSSISSLNPSLRILGETNFFAFISAITFLMVLKLSFYLKNCQRCLCGLKSQATGLKASYFTKKFKESKFWILFPSLGRFKTTRNKTHNILWIHSILFHEINSNEKIHKKQGPGASPK